MNKHIESDSQITLPLSLVITLPFSAACMTNLRLSHPAAALPHHDTGPAEVTLNATRFGVSVFRSSSLPLSETSRRQLGLRFAVSSLVIAYRQTSSMRGFLLYRFFIFKTQPNHE